MSGVLTPRQPDATALLLATWYRCFDARIADTLSDAQSLCTHDWISAESVNKKYPAVRADSDGEAGSGAWRLAHDRFRGIAGRRKAQGQSPAASGPGNGGGGAQRRGARAKAVPGEISAEDGFPRLTTAQDKSYRSYRTAPTLVGFALGQARTITTIK